MAEANSLAAYLSGLTRRFATCDPRREAPASNSWFPASRTRYQSKAQRDTSRTVDVQRLPCVGVSEGYRVLSAPAVKRVASITA